MRKVPLRVSKLKFGEIPAALEERVNAMESEDEFEAFVASCVGAKSLDGLICSDGNWALAKAKPLCKYLQGGFWVSNQKIVPFSAKANLAKLRVR